MNEASKRDFVKQMITLIDSNQATLTEKGFDPTTRLTALQTSSDEASAAEVAQQEAIAAMKTATAASNEKLSTAYATASNFADLISGLLGKSDPIVQEIRKMRK